jgi:murein DD-endopeptidase MepM/ murein hydrolase activator NlpD
MPLESMTLLRPFDNTRMRQSSATGLWALHDAADYAGAEGAKVSAMADGTVINCADSGVFGAYAEIDHGGVIVRYANLSMLYAIRAGDPVRAGQTIGFIGRTMPEERDLPAHLHLRIVVGDTAVDPEKVLQSGVFPDP